MSGPAGRTGAARKDRLAKVRAAMIGADVDALLLSHGADLPWLTGYRAMPLERVTLLVLPVDGDAVLLVPALEAPKVPDPVEVFTVRPWAETEDPLGLAATLLRHIGALRLGISERAWASTLLGLEERLPDATFTTASTITSPLRAVKDADEIAVLRSAAGAADRVAASLQAGEIPMAGRTERQVSDDIAARLLAEGHRRVNFAIVGSGPNGASPHHDAGDRVIEKGDLVVCDFGGELVMTGEEVGYCSDITRTVAIGPPPAVVQECYGVLLAAQRAGVDAAAPGATAESVDAAARRVIEEAGYGAAFIHRTGHGIGIEEHEDPYMVAGNDTVLVPGHAFSVEPGIYFADRFGMRLEDIVVVGDTGPEPLNTVDHDLCVVDA
ncbi:MAG: M24 family metallopeptidase [Acidimicrobiales bacterium]